MKLRTAVFVAIGVMVILIAYRVLVPRQAGVSKTLPDRLVGTWITGDSRISDWFVRMEDDAITFGTGGVVGKRYRVTAFDREYEADGTVVNTVHYVDVNRSRHSRKFILSSEDPPTLVFRDQPGVVWFRQQ